MLQQDDTERSLIESDLSTKVASLASKNFLLIHSTADCVVHEQHAALLTRSLVNRGIIFRHQVSGTYSGAQRKSWTAYISPIF